VLSDRTWEDLEREVLGREFGRCFKQRFQCEAAIARFDGPSTLIDFLHDPSGDYAEKDAALRALLRAFQAGGPRRPALGAFLLVILRPSLKAIVGSKLPEFRDIEDLWADVCWAFLETAWCYPIERRPSRVASNLKLDTLNRLCAVQRERSQQQGALRELRHAARRETQRLESPPGDATTPETTATPGAEVTAEAVVRACARAVQEGRISEVDRLLITMTRVYGRELKEFAREQRLPYEMAKKRRQRAERVVRDILQDRPPA